MHLTARLQPEKDLLWCLKQPKFGIRAVDEAARAAKAVKV